MFRSVFLAISLLIVATGQAHAYIDPGIGSIILQSLIALIAAASVAIGHYWHRIKTFFRSDDSGAEPSERRVENRD